MMAMIMPRRIALALTVLGVLAARTVVCAFSPLSQLYCFDHHHRPTCRPAQRARAAAAKKDPTTTKSSVALRLQQPQDSTQQSSSSSSFDGFKLQASERRDDDLSAIIAQGGSVQTAATVIGQQGLLIPVALLLGQLLGTTPFELQIDAASVSYGLLAVVPMALTAVGLDVVEEQFPALKDVTIATQRAILLFLGGSFRPVFTCVAALGIGLAAGLGEELLFRGVIQTKLVDVLLPLSGAASTAIVPVAVAILLSSLAFGALHAVTPVYVLLATLASIYFGYLLVAFDGNLIVPIVCHAVYDFGALVYAHWEIGKMTTDEQMDLLRGPSQQPPEVEQ
jgi:membrane protease YdiL (CAAX protease family)